MRERSLNPPEAPDIRCPECGEELSATDTIYITNDVVSCRHCTDECNAWEWYEEEMGSVEYATLYG